VSLAPSRTAGGAPAWRERLVFAYLQEPPFCFRRGDAAVSGCDVELAQTVAVIAGAGPFLPVEAEFAQLLPGLAEGRWAMTTGLFITEERRARVAFSRPIWALHDGLLVRAGDTRGFAGYRALARDPSAVLGVIVDQVQHATALRLGVAAERVRLFRTQDEAATAVVNGEIDAYASVASAHRGYLANRPDDELAVIDVPADEQPPAFGAFAFAKESGGLHAAIDAALTSYLGSPAHRALTARYGFTASEVDRIL